MNVTRGTDKRVENEYRRLNNQVRWLTRNSVRIEEKEVAKHMKGNPKVFWKYELSKTRTKSCISDLYKTANSMEVTMDKEKADVLSEQFARVFTQEPEGDSSPASLRETPRLNNTEITHDKIRKMLQKLKRNKSPGRDRMHPRIIRELTEDLLEPLRILFTSSLQEGVSPED